MTSSTSSNKCDPKHLKDVGDLLRTLNQKQREVRDALEAISEDVEDEAIVSALDNLSDLKEELRSMAEHIEAVIQNIPSQ